MDLQRLKPHYFQLGKFQFIFESYQEVLQVKFKNAQMLIISYALMFFSIHKKYQLISYFRLEYLIQLHPKFILDSSLLSFLHLLIIFKSQKFNLKTFLKLNF